MSESKGRKAGRDAKSGHFVPIDYARKHPSTTVVEVIKKPTPPKKK